MPLDLDFLTQIINVHWGGLGDFAIGGTVIDATKEGPIGVFYSVELEEEWANTRMDPDSPAPPPATDNKPVPSGGLGPRGKGMWYNNIQSMVGGKFKSKKEGEPDKKILAAGGYRSVMTGMDSEIFNDDGVIVSWHYNYQTTAILFWSDDGGKTWTEVTNPVIAAPPSLGVAQDVTVRYLAFDPAAGKFYGDVSLRGSTGLVAGVLQTTAQRHLISSSDGKAWKIEASEIRDITLGAEDFTSPFLAKILSIKNNGLTEIINTDADPEVKLTYTTVAIVPDGFGGTIKLATPWKVTPAPVGLPEEDGISLGAIPRGPLATDGTGERGNRKGFAYANGRFLIAGSLMATFDDTNLNVQAYVSDDDGKTWKKTLDDNTTFLIADEITYVPGCTGSCGCAGA